MFLETINADLFRPLASRNAKLYGIGLWALYTQLVVRQMDRDECSPKEARSIIRLELIARDQQLEWSEEDDSLSVDDGTDDATRVYAYLKQCGWLHEVDDIGYRRVTYFPRIATQLLAALDGISGNNAARIGATCQGVYTALLTVSKDPATNAHQVNFAAEVSRRFYSDLSNIAASTREVAHKMKDLNAGPELFQSFFSEFMGDALGDYSQIKTRSHPYRYRQSTLQLAAAIATNEEKKKAIIETLIESGNVDRATVEDELTRDLNDITRSFEAIEGLIERIETYRSNTTHRATEALRYSLRARPEAGRDLENLIKAISDRGDESIEYYCPVVEDHYIGPTRFYKPRVKKLEAVATSIRKQAVPIEAIAFDRAYSAFLGRRAENPERLVTYLERHLGEKVTLSTDELSIEGIDDLLAFIQLRNLINGSIPKDSPYTPLLNDYRVTATDGLTENDYFTAPTLRIDRRQAAPKRTN